MKPRKPTVFALLAALLLGQWLAFAHATQHELQAGSDPACEQCVSGHGFGLLPESGLRGPQALPRASLAPAAPALQTPRHRNSQPHNRGPPALA